MHKPRELPQPIPYQGSKRQLAPTILTYFPGDVGRLVEPFAGSAAISIAAAHHRLTQQFWLNDGHAPLIDLWRAILNDPEQLADDYQTLWHDQEGNERQYFNQVRARFNAEHAPKDFLYLLARCVKAAIRYNSSGEFNNTPDNRRKGAKPAEMRRRILKTAGLLGKGTKLTSWDYKKVLTGTTEHDVVYMDPPYQGVCGNRDDRYLPKVDHLSFCEELAKLNERGIRYIVSYDGRTGEKVFGDPLPCHLDLTHIEVTAGRSTQATLLGRTDVTVESLYLSPALSELLGKTPRAAACTSLR